MISRRGFVFAGAAAALVPGRSEAQCAPIGLGIPNIPQETQVWCWAAVAQQIIYWKTGDAPPQCALVAIANGAHPGFCCSGNPQCAVTGHLQQIQFLIGQFGGSMSTIAPPAGPGPVYNTLSNGNAIIMAVQSSPFSGHVVVINGMSCYGPNAVLHINDPIGWPMLSQPVPFQQVLPFWSAAIVVS
ncbi:MAG: papain-like cysteine protease family protein [Thalassobaculum sp.]|jgi:hypothetical protein